MTWRAAAFVLTVFVAPILAEERDDCLACNREMRKTFEAVQAWRRLHNGHYPGRLVDLKHAGLLSFNDAICPEVLGERSGATASHSETTSRLETGDPPGTYEYEMSDKVLKSGGERIFLPSDAPDYTRQDVKAELLRRPFFEQVPLLRCSSHRAVAPPPFAGKDDVRRNITIDGSVYWSRTFWEQLWLDDVPYCAREANVLFGLKGPPFHTQHAPALSEALDLRKWTCAFGDHAWWWTFPLFEEGTNSQWAAHLRPFFQEKHGRIMELAGKKWWVDGLVQLQGKVLVGRQNIYKGPGMEAFAWRKTGVDVGRAINGAAWLQGTAWPAKAGETNGWLVWHYIDGAKEHVPIIYGKNTARFWIEPTQAIGEKDFVQPVWQHHETTATSRKERWLRIYEQNWVNPRPQVAVVSLDFVSNEKCSAAPFLIAVTISQ